GLWLLCRGLWPQVVARADEVCARGLIRPFLVGLPITAALILSAAILSQAGTVGKITATAIVCCYLMIANSGVAGLITGIGRRLASPIDSEWPWRATLRGGIVLELSFLLPVLGWFVILPLSVTIGCGAACIALFRKVLVSITARTLGPRHPLSADADSTSYTDSMGAQQ